MILNIERVLIIIILSFSNLFQLFLILKIESISSFFNNIIILPLILLMITTLSKVTLKDLSLLIIALFFSIFNNLLKYFFVSSFDLRNFFYINLFFCLMILVKYIKLSPSIMMVQSKITILLILVYFLESFNSVNIGFYPENFLMYGYSNPNVLAYTLLVNLIYIYIFKMKYKIINGVFSVVSMYLIFQTGSRTALLSGFFILIFFIFGDKIIEKLFRILSYISIVIPIIVVSLQSTINKVFIYFIPDSLDFGKASNLNARDVVWNRTLTELSSSVTNIFFGVNGNSNLISTNTHNYLLFLLFREGLFSLILYLIILYRTILYKIKKSKYSLISMKSLVGWFAIILLNSFESHLVYGYISMTILSVFLLGDLTDEKVS